MSNEFLIKNGLIVSGSTRISGGVTAQSFTGSFTGSISTAISASYATTASYLNPLAQNVSVTGNVQASNLVSVADVASGNKIYNNNFYVTNDGSTNIGNGQSVATAKLQIKGSGATSSTTSLLVQNSAATELFKIADDGVSTFGNAVVMSNSGDRGKLTWGGGNFVVAALGGQSLALNVDSTNVLYVQTGTKNVGIGTSTPAYTLDVSGSARFTDTIYTNFAVATATTAVLARGFSDGNFQLVTQNGASVSGYGISTTFGMIYSGSGDVAKINFHRGTGAGTGHISISSPLKIGDTSTTAPAAQFTVKGSGTTSSTTALLIQNSAGTTTTSVLDDGRLSCYGDLYVGTSSGGGASIFQNSGNILNLTADNNHDVTLTQIKARRVPAGGGVRIENTNAPSNPDSSAQLDVVSTTKGLLPPRTNLTSNISTPAQGLQTYITASATEGLYYYNSGSYQGWTRVLNDSGSQAISGSLTVTGGITGSFSGSGTITSASFASTASYVNPLVQNVLVTGSMYVSGSINAGSQVVLGYNVNNGYLSFPQNGSNEIAAAQYLYITKTGGSGWLQIRSWNFVDIDSSLGVGLNSVTPSARLHVKGSGATSSTTALLIQNANATASLSVLDDGRVGIGTSTPTASLEIVDNSATTTTPLRVKNGSSSGTAGIAIVGGPIGNQASSVLIQGVDIGGWKQNMAVSIYDGTSGGGGSVVERLRLYDNGSLGLIGGSTDLPNMLRLTNGQDTLGNRTGIHFGTYSKVAIYNIVTTTTSYGRGALGFAINDAVSSATASLSDEKMRLTAVGLGIGTTTPSASLHVVGNTILSGSAGSGSALYAYKSGSTVVDIQGSQGQLFSVIDALSGSLMSVNDISGLPILEVFSDDRVVMGTYGAPALTITGSNAVFTGSVIIDGALLDTVRTGSLPIGSTLIYAINTGSYTAGFFDYYAASGSNYRAGNIMAVWGANTIRYTDLATPDIGTTIQLQFSMSLSNATAQLFATATSTGWTVKTVFRTI